MRYPVVSNDPRIQALYVRVRKNLKAQLKDHEAEDAVSDHRFAEMLAFQQAPRSMTDREFFSGIGTLDQQFKSDPQHLKTITSNAKRRGYNPSPHDVYVPTLAREPGDPAAFISGGRGQLKKRAESLGLESHGAVTTKAREPGSDPRKRNSLAPDVMNQLMAHETRKAKREGKKVSRGEIREKVLAQHRYKM